MIAGHHISPFSHSHSNLSLPLHLHFSPCHICLTQPVWQHSMLKHSQGRWSKSAVNSHYNALTWCFLTSQAFLKCCQGPWGYFTAYLLSQLFSISLSLSLSGCVWLQLKIWLTEMLLWSYLHMVWVYIMPSSKTYCLKITDLTQSPEVIQMRTTTSKPPSFYNVITVFHSPAVSNIVLE